MSGHTRAPFRKTSQYLAPARTTPTSPGTYDIYPAFSIGPGKIGSGYEALASHIAGSGQRLIVIDGYVGVLWDRLRERLDRALRQLGVDALWRSIDDALLPAHAIDKLTEPFLGGDDPLFGTRCTLHPREFFTAEKLGQMHQTTGDAVAILYGSGASLCSVRGYLVYVDVPKNEIQFRSRAGSIRNFGADHAGDARTMYKRLYFVDWPVLNRIRRDVLPLINLIVDEQRPDEPVFMDGSQFRRALDDMATSCFRVRPWFEPGPWGGQWIKSHVPQVAREVPNYAWSFELISPENGIAFESDGSLLEVSFDFLMLHNHRDVLGLYADRFGYEFPIRYDFLDTFDGGNLSLQCHPRSEYAHRHFGETFTQDETYYILDCKPGARVYLGFTSAIDPRVFRDELERSVATGCAVDVERHVATLPAHRHDLFLIPNGTVHCSGVDNLVLEISATPYIFTFKMYDWMRADLDGKPRTLNIGRAFENLYFDRQGSRITSEFVSQPRLIHEESDWRVEHVPTHSEHFYDVHRLTFSSSLEVETEGSCHVMSLVEGSSVMVETGSGRQQRFNYAESFVIPAAAGRYRLINNGPLPAKVVKTFLKPGARPFAQPEGATS
ncbi:MAG: class I mannose-6-phosphate isomerase [Ignavibacteria bacterium]|nr:class I mannose-6-phosphate isomerase [Ignavibacteria bacterium]